MSTKQIIILSAVMVSLMLASVGASFFLMNHVLEQRLTEVLPEEMLAEEEEVPEEEAVEEIPPPIYIPLEPFVINFLQDGALRYLQVTMELMSRDQLIVDQVNASLPEIRNSLIMLMSDYSYDQLSSREGKEQIREAIPVEVNSIIEHEDGVESVFITGFVMQ